MKCQEDDENCVGRSTYSSNDSRGVLAVRFLESHIKRTDHVRFATSGNDVAKFQRLHFCVVVVSAAKTLDLCLESNPLSCSLHF